VKRYVVVWIECEDDDAAEAVEASAVYAVELIAHGRLVQNRIQEDQP
jgi:hypothetical protein